jgi:hypothetical protein
MSLEERRNANYILAERILKKTHLEDLSRDGKMLLKLVFSTEDGMV